MRTSPIVARRLALVAGVTFAFVAGCKSEESLIIFELTADSQAGQQAAVTLSAGDVDKSFPLAAGLSAAPLSFGVYVPGSLTGNVGVSAKAMPATGCVGYHGTATVDITKAGSTVIVPITMRKQFVCTLDAGADGGGQAGADAAGQGGTTGQAGAGGTTGQAGTGGTTGQAGAGGSTGQAGAGGSTGQAGAGGSTGQAGMGGSTGLAGMGGSTGQAGMGGSPGTVVSLSRCSEINHDDTKACNDNCDPDLEDWAVFGVAFSPDGTLMVTGGDDGRIKIWQVANQVPTPSGHVLMGDVGVIAFSSDGKLLAVGENGSIQIWTVGTWTAPLRSLTVTRDVYGLAFSPDNTQIISVDHDPMTGAGTLYVHSVSGGAALHTLDATNVYNLAVSRVLVGGVLPVAFTTDTGKLVYTTLGATGFSTPTTMPVTSDGSVVEAVEFSPNSSLLAAGGDDGVANFWSLSSTGLSTSLPTIDLNDKLPNGYSGFVGAIAFDEGGDAVAIGGGFFGSVSAWNVVSPRAQIGTLFETANVYDMVSLTYSASAKLIAGGEVDCGCVVVCKQ
jgi:WD40 domain-containing protein